MLLNVPHRRQRREGECLPTCVAMVFAYWGRWVIYRWLVWRLGTTSIGTYFSNIDRLWSWRFKIERDSGDIDTLHAHLEDGCPIIVPVAAEILPHWIERAVEDDTSYQNNHAVVVVGIDDYNVYINDPDFDEAPLSVETDWFIAAWQFYDYHYAVVKYRR